MMTGRKAKLVTALVLPDMCQLMNQPDFVGDAGSSEIIRQCLRGKYGWFHWAMAVLVGYK